MCLIIIVVAALSLLFVVSFTKIAEFYFFHSVGTAVFIALVSTLLALPLILKLLNKSMFSGKYREQLVKNLIRIVVFGTISSLCALLQGESLSGGFMVFSIGSLIVAMFNFFRSPNDSTVNRDKENAAKLASKMEDERMAKEAYSRSKDTANIPQNVKTIDITVQCPQLNIHQEEHYIWLENNNIKLFPRIMNFYDCVWPREFICVSIPKEQIRYFTTSGEIYRETKISGGGGGGSSISGAIVGGMIAGDTGAVIGSRKKTDEIKSELITHDSRQTIMEIIDPTGDEFSVQIKFEHFSILMDIIPEKEISFVNSMKQHTLIAESQKNLTNNTEKIILKIQELAKLKDDGIITQEEFEEQKKILLSKYSA